MGELRVGEGFRKYEEDHEMWMLYEHCINGQQARLRWCRMT